VRGDDNPDIVKRTDENGNSIYFIGGHKW
jgi:hypothetical protein